ncbi:MAG TPA: cation:proton antiporter [Roseiarcus sp.]|nr:cation:proton antiporter [Roseiarcus sp.]
MLDIVVVLAVLSSLLVVVALSQPLAGRLRLSPVVLLAVIGAAIGAASGVLLNSQLSPRVGEAVTLFANLPLGSETFIYVFLPLLVFEAAFTSDVRRIIEDAAPILMLAVVATVITAVIVGLALWPFAGMSLVVCLLLGAVISTTDPAAVIALFRDVGAPARLTRLVAGESLLNDAAAIVLYAVLLGIIVSGRRPVIGSGALEFVLSFIGGGALGVIAGRAFLQIIPWLRDDRLAEGTLTVALAYLAFIAAERLFHVSGVVAVLASGMTVGAFGRTRIGPDNWTFLTDLWEQIAFWAHSLVFLLASILIPRLLFDVRPHDLTLVAVLIVAAFAARLGVLFILLPMLSLARLTKPISTVYKLAIAWGGLRGALTLVLALGVTENPALPLEVRRFVAVLATGLVLFTLLVNGTTLRAAIRLLGLDRLSPVDRLLRDRVLELSYADTSEMIAKTAKDYGLQPTAVERALKPYEAWTKAEKARNPDGESELTERARLAVALVALGNQERMLVLEMLARGAASPAALQALMRNAEALVEAARSGGRLGYKRAAEAALAFPLSFRAAYFFYRRFGVRRFLADRLGDRFETLLVTRLIIHDLSGGAAKRSRSIFSERAVALIDQMLEARLEKTVSSLDALRRQYVGYAAALEARFLRQSALRREMGRYQALFDGGLISAEVYRDLASTVEQAQRSDLPPRFDIGLDRRELIKRLELFKALDARRLEAVQKLLRPRFTVPNELIVRKGERGDAMYFIASGAAEVTFPNHRIRLGSGDVFGEMSLLTGEPRQADIRALTYCRLLVLRKTDFDRFMRDNRDVRLKIHQIAQTRAALNRADPAAAEV